MGVGMLQDAIRRTLMSAEQAGARALLTHPIDAGTNALYGRFVRLRAFSRSRRPVAFAA